LQNATSRGIMDTTTLAAYQASWLKYRWTYTAQFGRGQIVRYYKLTNRRWSQEKQHAGAELRHSAEGKGENEM